MLQTIIAVLIIAGAVILTLIYIIRGFLRIKNKESACSHCGSRNVCKDIKAK